jgi:hypothetical protein
MKAYEEVEIWFHTFLNLYTRIVSLMPWPLYHHGSAD